MYWTEVTMRDSNTKRFESDKLNDIYALLGKYAHKSRKGTKATEMKFGRDNEQTGTWDPVQGIRSV